MSPPGRATDVDTRDAGLGAAAIVLGIVVAAVARGFPGGSAYDVLGPRLLPYIIAVGLVLTGLPILIGALRRSTRKEEPEPWDALPVILIALGLVVPILLITTIGWIPVASIVFAIGARAFGSRTTLLDLAIGLAFGTVTFLLFNHGLGLHLPLGSLIAGPGN
jgi:putative tricarboxylic transport membrane protein